MSFSFSRDNDKDEVDMIRRRDEGVLSFAMFKLPKAKSGELFGKVCKSMSDPTTRLRFIMETLEQHGSPVMLDELLDTIAACLVGKNVSSLVLGGLRMAWRFGTSPERLFAVISVHKHSVVMRHRLAYRFAEYIIGYSAAEEARRELLDSFTERLTLDLLNVKETCEIRAMGATESLALIVSYGVPKKDLYEKVCRCQYAWVAAYLLADALPTPKGDAEDDLDSETRWMRTMLEKHVDAIVSKYDA